MHHQANIFLELVKSFLGDDLKNKTVLDVGSLDINGNNRWMFENCEYTGIDLAEGKNVDFAMSLDKYYWDIWQYQKFDIVISTEMFEHDRSWATSIMQMIGMCSGWIIFTCATTGRKEHGTTRTTPKDSPATNDYYKNLKREDFEALEGFKESFEFYHFFTNNLTKDLYFYGRIKAEEVQESV